jgi:hypothetical protein
MKNHIVNKRGYKTGERKTIKGRTSHIWIWLRGKLWI